MPQTKRYFSKRKQTQFSELLFSIHLTSIGGGIIGNILGWGQLYFCLEMSPVGYNRNSSIF